MRLDQQEFPRLTFGRNPLKVVVTQIRFPPIFAVEQPGGIAPIQSVLADDFPIAEGRSADVSITIGPTGPTPPQTQLGPWRFRNEGGDWIVAVAPDYFSLETTSYRDFEEFVDRSERVIRALDSVLQIRRRTRLGLRYIDEITHPKAITIEDWKRFVRAELLGVAGCGLFDADVRQAIQQVSASDGGGDVTMRLAYARTEPGSTLVIDLDAFDDKADQFDVPTMLGQMAAFKRRAWTAFRYSITDELVSYLGGEPRA